MNDKQLEAFARAVHHFFSKLSSESPQVGIPHRRGDEEPDVVYDYTGMIGIAGLMQGAIYITLQGGLVDWLLLHSYPGTNANNDSRLAMAAELANTIAGNVQETLGAGFQISVPVAFSNGAATSSIRLQVPTFLIPFEIGGFKACLAVGVRGV